MLKYDKQVIGKRAAELSFIRDTFEKVLRLIEILKFMNEDSTLKTCLALKGGTAINLTIFDLPRLSVDIDLDYTSSVTLEKMKSERETITTKIKKYMFAEVYELSPKSKFSHSLDSFVFTYTNAAGIKDNIKIEINYSLRSHILETEKRKVLAENIASDLKIITLSPIEIFGSKIVALLSRAAARDLYDISNMISLNLFDSKEKEILKKCVVFYSAIAMKTPLTEFSFNALDTITKYKIRTDLNPVIHKKDKFDLETAKTNVKDYLSNLLAFNPDEQRFLREFKNKIYKPELLFSDKKIISKIENHPMAMWKIKSKMEEI
ncbi:MAG: nucleotidyl transferase AbiEii/AbiGii toxin family protein [Oscillospiraceae bacterium]|nr:nucleotidyl transferase AbiEii/AbiGii toxin family protein [Oscillospiraceae bacterium]